MNDKKIEYKRIRGRPAKTEEQKRLKESNYNKSYYQTVTKARLKLQDTLLPCMGDNKSCYRKEYREALQAFFGKYHFNNFFTGTNNPNYIEREELRLVNKKIDLINRELGANVSFENRKKMSLNGLVRYTNKFIGLLMDLKAINRAVVFYEQNQNREWHCHILINVINDLIIDVNNYLEDKWLIGISLNVPINSQKDKQKLLQYSTKQIALNGNRQNVEEKVLNWNFIGDYEEPKNKEEKNMKEKTRKEQIQFLERFKDKNGLTVKVNPLQQMLLNAKYVRQIQ